MLMNLPESGTNRRILIIDDNRAIHEDFAKIFSSVTQEESQLVQAEQSLFEDEMQSPVSGTEFLCDSAFQGQEGLLLVQQALAEQRPYALAFVDVRMPPGWDGIETIERIWKEDPAIQIVICTAYSDYSWNEMVRKLGNSDQLVILKKPFDTIEVLQLAQTMTQRWQSQREDRLKIEKLEQLLREREVQTGPASSQANASPDSSLTI